METDAILEQLERLAASEQLSRSKRLLRFLHFTLDRTLSGNAETLSEYAIGRHVYDRAEDFDPLTDGIVRVEAHRLRSKLREYYKSAGRQDPIIFEYPVGSYVPVFHRWAPEFLPQQGHMAQVIRAYDWSASPLGPLASWPRELRSGLNCSLQMKFPAAVFWRGEFTILYNDAMHALIDDEGSYHVGRKLVDFAPEVWPPIELMIRGVYETGESTSRDKVLWLNKRSGATREGYFTISCSPIMDSAGAAAGVLIVAVDVTDSVLHQRRGQTLTDLAGSAPMTGDEDACLEAARILERNPFDLPFAAVYLFDATGNHAEFRSGAGIQSGTGVSPKKLSLRNGTHPLAQAMTSSRAEILEVGRQLGPLPLGVWKAPPVEIAIVPIHASPDREPLGAIVAGISVYRPVDADYRTFLENVARQVSASILRARTHGRERKLTTEMEQHKSTWASFLDFASEEFRTPLTVALELLDKVIGEHGAKGPHYSTLMTTRRSALRLWNAADTLMDLIRIQTDRWEPVFAPVDLSTVTEGLARAFASELALPGLRFSLDCPPLEEDVYVDRRLWDRLILNLLVSAVHRTDQGEIGISIRKIGPWIDTAVWDTGTSISEEEPLVFKRFRDNPDGAGLALARHFAACHGGHLTVKSERGKGNRFVVSLPPGRSHLKGEHVMETPEDIRASLNSLYAHVEDAATRWTPERDSSGLGNRSKTPNSEPHGGSTS